MRIVLSCLLVHLCMVVTAQDAAFPDYRTKKDGFLKMQEKDIRADLATFTIAGIVESIGKAAVPAVTATGFGSNFMQFANNNVQVTITAGPFDASRYKLKYFEDKYLIKIDNKPFYGSFGRVPKTAVTGVTVVVDKDTVAIPPAAFADLFNPSFTYTDASGKVKSHNGVYLSADKHKIYVYMLNRESSGTYEVTWVIQDKKYLRRVVDFELLK